MTGLDGLALEERSGLPEPLRPLLTEFPRDAWQTDPGFGPLIRFWLERHLMFRSLLSQMTEQTRAVIQGQIDPLAYSQGLSRLGGAFVGGLHEHHHVEDAHYFPRLKCLDPRLENGFSLLDADHHSLDAHLEQFTERTDAVLRSGLDQRPLPKAGPFLDGLDQFTGLLDRHLTDEEEIVVPVLLKYGEAAVG